MMEIINTDSPQLKDRLASKEFVLGFLHDDYRLPGEHIISRFLTQKDPHFPLVVSGTPCITTPSLEQSDKIYCFTKWAEAFQFAEGLGLYSYQMDYLRHRTVDELISRVSKLEKGGS